MLKATNKIYLLEQKKYTLPSLTLSMEGKVTISYLQLASNRKETVSREWYSYFTLKQILLLKNYSITKTR